MIAKVALRYIKNRVMAGLGHISPIMAFWEVTGTCNARCVYCNIWRLGKKFYPNEIGTEGCLSLIDLLAKRGVVVLNLNGGDYLNRRDLPKILEHAKKKGMFSVVNTNGLMLKERVSLLKDNTELLFVMVDSMDTEINNKMRGVPNSLKRVISGIKKARKLGIDVRVRTFVHKMNVNHLSDIAELCLELDVRFRPIPLITAPVEFRDESDAKNLSINIESYLNVIKKLKSEYSNIDLSRNYIKFIEGGGFFVSKPCTAHSEAICIKPDGKFAYPCSFRPMVKTIQPLSMEEKEDLGYLAGCKGCLHSCFFLPKPLELLKGLIV